MEAKSGSQDFEIFGNVFDFPGVDPAPVSKEDPYGIMAHFHYRFLTVQNSSPLTSPADKPVTNKNWVTFGDAHFIRADDRWTDAWGQEFATKNWLKPSHGGSDHFTRGKPAVYKEVMKDTSYAVIERIEFDLPWQWPPASVQPFMKDGKLEGRISRWNPDLAEKAWRRPLTESEGKKLDALISEKLKPPIRKSMFFGTCSWRSLPNSVLVLLGRRASPEMHNHELVDAWLLSFGGASRTSGLRAAPATARSRTRTQCRGEAYAGYERVERFIEDFVYSWAGLPKVDQIAVNPNYYRWWNPSTRITQARTGCVYENSSREDLSCLNLLSSDFMVVNSGWPSITVRLSFERAPLFTGPRNRGAWRDPHAGGVPARA